MISVHIFRYSFTGLIFGLSLGLTTLGSQVTGLPLVEALLRARNYAQAERILRNKGTGLGPSVLYHGVIAFGQGHHQESLQLLKQAYPEASAILKRRVLDFMQTALKSQSAEPVIFLALYELFLPEIGSHPRWKEWYIESLLETNQFERVLEEMLEPRSPRLLRLSYKAYKHLKQDDKFFMKFGKSHFHSPSLKLEYIRILLESGRIKEVRKRFTQVRNQKNIWVANFHLILGTELNDPGLVEAGYRLKISLNPSDFSLVQGLSNLYFQLEKDTEAEAVLMNYLRRDPNQYKGAREIAQVFIDHGRFQKLLEFVSSLRTRLKNPRLLFDVVLYTFSIRKEFESFYTELSAIYPKIQGRTWGRKILDSFQPEDLEQAYKILCSRFAKSPAVQAQVLLTLASKSSATLGDWVDRDLARFPLPVRIQMAKNCLKDQFFDLVPKVFKKDLEISKSPSPEISYLLGTAYIRLGKFHQAYSLLVAGLDYPDKSPHAWLDLYTISHHLPLYRKDLEKWHAVLIKNPVIKSLSMKRRREFHAQWGEVLVFSKRFEELDQFLAAETTNLTQGVRQYLGALRYLFQGEIKEAFVFLNTFLNHRVGSPYFTRIQEVYTLLLQLQEVFNEKFLAHYLASLRFAYLGQPDSLSLSLNLLEKSVSGHWAAYLFADYIQASRLQTDYLQWKAQPAGENYDLAQIKWERGALKLFEDFPDSLYTPRVVRQLVRHLEKTGRIQETRELIKKVLTQSTADLLAQSLRNRLLAN